MNPEQEVLALTAELERQGADPAAAPQTAIARLREMREKREVSDMALVSILEGTPSEDTAQLLAEIAAGTHGAPRRAAKRALFKLRQRGFGRLTPLSDAAPASSRYGAAAARSSSAEPKGPASAPKREDVGLAAMMSPFDAAGARVVWLLKELPQGGMRRLWGVVSRSRGLVAIMASRLSRRQLREERAEVERESELRLIEAAPKLADFILCEAYRRTAPNERAAVGSFLQVRAELTGAAVPVEIEHPIYQELAGALDSTPSPALLDDPVMAAFAPSETELRPFADAIEQIRQSPLVLNSAQQQERMKQIADRALLHMLEGERRTAARRYLEDTAYYLERVERKEPARWAAAAAKMLAQGADVGREPVFRRWIELGLDAALAQSAQQQLKSPRLIVTPAEARRAAGSKKAPR